MPTYVKLPKVLSDYAVGVESVNQMIDNMEAMRSSLSLRHGEQDGAYGSGPGGRPRPWEVIGAHDALTIPRAIVRIYLESITPNLTHYVCSEIGSIVTSFQRLSAGLLFFPVAQLATFWGEFIPEAASVTPVYVCQPRSYYATTGGGVSGVYVECYDLSAGAFTLADMAGTLTVYGSPGP